MFQLLHRGPIVMIRNAAHETCPKFICPRGLASCSFYILDREERFLEEKKKKDPQRRIVFVFLFCPKKLDFGGKKKQKTEPDCASRYAAGVLVAALGRDY